MRARNERRERGAAAVEFALVLPVLLLIVLGTIDWGWYFYVSQIVTNAAREGARTGTLVDPDDPNADQAAIADAEGAAAEYLRRVGLTAGTVQAVNDGNAIRVTVTYPTGSITGFQRLIPLLPANTQAVAHMRR